MTAAAMKARKAKPALQVTLTEWAAARFKRVPHIVTLRRWAREQHIEPAPERVGREWKVDPRARYVALPSSRKAKA